MAKNYIIFKNESNDVVRGNDVKGNGNTAVIQLHPESNANDNLYPNVLEENIPQNIYTLEKNVDYTKYVVSGKYVNVANGGNFSNLDSMNSIDKMPVDNIIKLSLTYVGTGGNAGIAGFNADGVFVKKLNTTSWTPSSETITIPEDIKYISMSYDIGRPIVIVATYRNNYLLSNVVDYVEEKKKVFNFKLPQVTSASKINGLTGLTVPDKWGHSSFQFIKIKGNIPIIMQNVTSLNDAYNCVYYDDSFRFISTVGTYGSEKITINQTTPSNARYLSITVADSNVGKVRVYTEDYSLHNETYKYEVEKIIPNKFVWIDDDGNPEGVERVYNVATLKDVPVTLAVLTSNFTQELVNRFKEMELKKIDISLHGHTHSSDIWSNTNTNSNLVAEDVVKGLRALKEFINARYLITPNGANSAMIQKIAKQYCNCSVSAWTGINNYSTANKYDLGRYWMTEHTHEEFKAFVDNLPVANHLIILASHSRLDLGWDDTIIQNDIEYLKTKGLEICSLKEAIDLFN